MDDHGPDRDISVSDGRSRLFEGKAHQLVVGHRGSLRPTVSHDQNERQPNRAE